MTIPVYYCWVCGLQVSGVIHEPDQEQPGRLVRFCSEQHRDDYRELVAL